MKRLYCSKCRRWKLIMFFDPAIARWPSHWKKRQDRQRTVTCSMCLRQARGRKKTGKPAGWYWRQSGLTLCPGSVKVMERQDREELRK